MYQSMTDLVSQEPAKGNYFFQIDDSRQSNVKLFAPHGGCIEPCTGNIVIEIAAGVVDYYIFNGIRKAQCYQTLHVTSTQYDEPRCLAMVRGAKVALAIHGCDGEESFMEVGGATRLLNEQLSSYLTRMNFPVVQAAQHRTGEDALNFINQASIGGLQLELSAGFRRSLFPYFPKPLQHNPTTLQPFVEAMKNWIHEIEQAIATNSGSFASGNMV